MNKQYHQVLEFTKTFGQPTPLERALPPTPLQGLRARLSEEESFELRCAINLNQYLDGCTDLLYIAIGNFIAAGFQPEDIQAAMDEVHRSNMSKLWTHEEVQQVRMGENVTSFGAMTVAEFDNRFDVKIAPGYEDLSGKRYIVSRKDGKVMKSPSFSPPNFSHILP